MPYDGFSLLLSVLIVKSNHVFGTQNLLAFDKFNAKLLGIRTKFSLWETTCSNLTIKTPVLNHNHKKRKDSLEKRAVLLIYLLELEIYGVAVQRIHENSQKWCLCKELLTENGFEAVLASFCSHDYGANGFEAVQKIYADQKEYHKCSSYVIVC